ncbi:uncharacterized protein LOC143217913 [Lasioglossum baleicum]|uniref:uncharacterized protein LOC143217913 n=1 Tax=Lasioglossum baleicum TaxID=434251 RepID=UPI003FCC30E8
MNNTNHCKNISSLKIIYWNSRSIIQHREELQQILQSVDIFICVESWLKPDIRLAFKGFNIIRRDRINKKGGGVAIFIKRDINYYVLPDIRSYNGRIESCVIKLTNTTPAINIVAIYKPQGPSLSQNNWDAILNKISNLSPCLLVGDFNAHNRAWNCLNNDTNGERLFNSILNHDIFLHNSDTITHFDFYRNGKSNIDLVLTTPNLVDQTSVHVLDDTRGSDHCLINIDIAIQKSKYVFNKITNKLSTLGTDWDKYQEMLSQKFPLFLSFDFNSLNCVEQYEFFVRQIKECIVNCTPQKRTVSTNKWRNPVPWWDEECNKVKRLRKAAYKKWRHTYDLVDMINFKKCVAIAKKTLKLKKKEYFLKFVTELDPNRDSTHFWNVCKKLKNKWTNTHSKSFSNEERQQKIQECLGKIAPPWVASDPIWLPSCASNRFFDDPFDFVEFNFALDKKKDKSAPGKDGIDYLALKLLPVNIKLILVEI